MNNPDKTNILIVGAGALACALANKFAEYEQVGKIYAACGNFIKYKNLEYLDIREDNLSELLEFVLENDIGLTIPISEKSLKSDIVSFFQANGQNVFAPPKQVCNLFFDKISKMKFLYKVRAQCPKFGAFNKIQLAQEYLKSANFPVIVSSSSSDELGNDRFVCPTLSVASGFLDDLYNRGETDVIIEEYIYGKNFTIYFITDGYSAIPINTVYSYKFDKKGHLTSGLGCLVPNLYVSSVAAARLQSVADNIIKALDAKSSPYVGILGIQGTLYSEDNFYVQDIKTFLSDYDARAVLNSCDDNLLNIFQACVNGYFSDEYEALCVNNLHSASVVVSAEYENEKISGFDNVEDISSIDIINLRQKQEGYYTLKGNNFVLTRAANTLSRARKYLSEDLSCINFKGMSFDSDICNNIEEY